MEEGVPEAEKVMCLKEVVEMNKDKQELEEEEEKGAKGGILNNLISNFMDATTTTTTVEGKSGENIQKFECEDENDKEKESSSVGVLEKIISHLPEDAAPTTEEAAILIHSAID
ncbi:hypothetical protein ISN45_Aa05g020230 [Arabidopsis thaliana x Arabidopsis arenosa]|uniref:Uncharacterized protein n=1 Tax=Arabidopsis thaliana x Arabidopsis arenosa TaxID=1240361 RepID=A0A8T1ZPD8_9BRAS|nr:hypothetical protein ISN45_Aa05g020230 [Arabidopsis thaliana x Arabidopsis arenosa]